MTETTFPFHDPSLPIDDLIGHMTLGEKVAQMLHETSGIPRLGIPEYNWSNECLHGVARAAAGHDLPFARRRAQFCRRG